MEPRPARSRHQRTPRPRHLPAPRSQAITPPSPAKQPLEPQPSAHCLGARRARPRCERNARRAPPPSRTMNRLRIRGTTPEGSTTAVPRPSRIRQGATGAHNRSAEAGDPVTTSRSWRPNRRDKGWASDGVVTPPPVGGTSRAARGAELPPPPRTATTSRAGPTPWARGSSRASRLQRPAHR